MLFRALKKLCYLRNKVIYVHVPPKGVFSHIVFEESMLATLGSEAHGTGEHEVVKPLHDPPLEHVGYPTRV